MSFGFIVAGLERRIADGAAVVVDRPAEDWDPGVADFECAASGVGDETVPCASMGSRTLSVTADVTTLLAEVVGAPDYLAVVVAFRGPQGFTGYFTACNAEFPFGCASLQWQGQETEVDGDYVDTAGVSIVNGGHTGFPDDPLPPNFTLGAETETEFDLGLLVNPSPTWPTPDGEGNTFGTVLWEPGDLPAAIAATVEVTCNAATEIPSPASLEVYLWPYAIIDGEGGSGVCTDWV